jgi:hypothetical protein
LVSDTASLTPILATITRLANFCTMPPNGLYPIGRFHQYGGAPLSKPRPVYNTKDFEDDKETLPAAAIIEGAALAVDGLREKFGEGYTAKEKKKSKKRSLGVATEQPDDKVEKKKQKKAKKNSLPTAIEVQNANEHVSSATPVAAGKQASISSPKGKKSKGKEAGEGATATRPTGKKREREVEQKPAPPVADSTLLPAGQAKDISIALPEWLQQLQSALGKTTTTINTLQQSNLLTQVPTKSTKKKAKVVSKSSESGGTVAAPLQTDDNAVLVTNELAPAEAVPKKASKKAKPDDSSKAKTLVVPSSAAPSIPARYAFPVKQSPVPLPEINGLPSTPQKTPLPLPQTPTHQRRMVKSADTSEILVTETPPSHMPRVTPKSWKAPIPFNLDGGLSSGREQSTNVPKITFSSPTTISSVQPRSSAPMTPFVNSQEDGILGSQASLTSSNLEQYSQPLNDEPKDRPRKRTSSDTSSLSSYTIQEALSRVRSKSIAASPDQHKKKHHPEIHEEADAKTFKSAYRVSQKCINFTQEEEYLETHLAARAIYDASGPLPCLRSGTGCTAAGEQKVLLAKEDTRKFLKAILSTEAEQAAFDLAVRSTLEAEKFLRMTIAAHTPVSIGKIEGVYTMYCPKYSATHVDKNSSKRTISIVRPRGFKSDTYTAVLTVPPRAGFQSTLAFTAPPHASFRMTMLTISNDQGELDIAFLGNGYLLVKMDLGRLIRGKKTKTEKGEDSYMEFFCVKEEEAKGKHGPLKWEFGPKRVEVKGALAQKHNGTVMRDDPSASALDPSPKKKVGRPTNAELARRAKVAEEEAAKKAQSAV